MVSRTRGSRVPYVSRRVSAPPVFSVQVVQVCRRAGCSVATLTTHIQYGLWHIDIHVHLHVHATPCATRIAIGPQQSAGHTSHACASSIPQEPSTVAVSRTAVQTLCSLVIVDADAPRHALGTLPTATDPHSDSPTVRTTAYSCARMYDRWYDSYECAKKRAAPRHVAPQQRLMPGRHEMRRVVSQADTRDHDQRRLRFLPFDLALGSSTPAAFASVSAAIVSADTRCALPCATAHFSRRVAGRGFESRLP